MATHKEIGEKESSDKWKSRGKRVFLRESEVEKWSRLKSEKLSKSGRKRKIPWISILLAVACFAAVAFVRLRK